MTELPINNESGTADVKWDSPRQTEPLLTLLRTHSYMVGQISLSSVEVGQAGL